MTYKVADKLGVERKSWKTAFLTSIYNETATVHGRIDRSEKARHNPMARCQVHGRIDRSEIHVVEGYTLDEVHGRIDRSEMSGRRCMGSLLVHGRIDRSEIETANVS